MMDHAWCGKVWRGVALLLLCTMGTGCSNKLKAENEQLWEENTALRGQLAEKQKEIDAVNADRATLMAQIEDLRTKKNVPVQASGDWKASPGQVTAQLQGDVLFMSGQATLKQSAKGTLNRLAADLKNKYAGKTVRIEGYTDTDPLVRTKKKWGTNLRLSVERAMAVQNYLASQGIPHDRMYSAGFGATKQLGSKAKSRRVQLVVILK